MGRRMPPIICAAFISRQNRFDVPWPSQSSIQAGCLLSLITHEKDVRPVSRETDVQMSVLF